MKATAEMYEASPQGERLLGRMDGGNYLVGSILPVPALGRFVRVQNRVGSSGPTRAYRKIITLLTAQGDPIWERAVTLADPARPQLCTDGTRMLLGPVEVDGRTSRCST